MRNVSRMKRSHRCAIRYAAIELAPITTRGNAHLRYPLTSVSQQNPARKRKQRPPLNSVHAGVQMRFTTGQIPVKCSSRPAATPIAPAASRRRIGCLLYTSDAADDLLCVDLGGRRIIKK